MLPGLHAAIWSLCRAYRGDSRLRITVFCDRISAGEKVLLEQTHAAAGPVGKLVVRDVNIPGIPGANSLHGNRTAYGRIFLADLMPTVDRVIYLDCDIVVATSIHHLAERLLVSGQTLIASGVRPRKSSRDRKLYELAGLDMQGCGFNSGVLGLDLVRWRRESRNDQLRDIAQRFSGMFGSADQALLNVAFAADYGPLPDEFNWHLYPTTLPDSEPSEAILHFVGSPKPWDPFGARLHRNYHLWFTIYRQTALRARGPWRYLSLRRGLGISRSIWKAWRSR